MIGNVNPKAEREAGGLVVRDFHTSAEDTVFDPQGGVAATWVLGLSCNYVGVFGATWLQPGGGSVGGAAS